MSRIYHHHDKWEDYRAGQFAMTYADQSDGQAMSALLLSDQDALYAAMSAVAREWPNSAEHNLTNQEQNRRAWLGQAACCFALGVPDFVVKGAWNRLSSGLQDAANATADVVIAEWEASRAETLFR